MALSQAAGDEEQNSRAMLLDQFHGFRSPRNDRPRRPRGGITQDHIGEKELEVDGQRLVRCVRAFRVSEGSFPNAR